jgi:hypothetical protein
MKSKWRTGANGRFFGVILYTYLTNSLTQKITEIHQKRVKTLRYAAHNIAFALYWLMNESSTFAILFIFSNLAVSKQKLRPNKLAEYDSHTAQMRNRWLPLIAAPFNEKYMETYKSF